MVRFLCKMNKSGGKLVVPEHSLGVLMIPAELSGVHFMSHLKNLID